MGVWVCERALCNGNVADPSKNKVDGAKSIDANSASWGVCAYAFDLLLLNDEVLVDVRVESHCIRCTPQCSHAPHVLMPRVPETA